MPDHSTFSKNRHGRFRESDLLRKLFEEVLARCIEEGLVGGEGFAVDASLIKADANRQKGDPGSMGLPPDLSSRAVDEYLAVLDDAAFGGASTAVRQAEITAQRTMIERTDERFGLMPQRLAADTAYGSAENLAWLVHEQGIEPHIPVFEKGLCSRKACVRERRAERWHLLAF